MDHQLKQRLVGISVIFALAVIFLPMLLDGSGQHLEKLDVKIPVPPKVDSRVDVKQQVIELKREVESLPVMAPVIVDEVSDAQAPDDKKTSDQPTVPQVAEKTELPSPTPKPEPAKAPEKPVQQHQVSTKTTPPPEAEPKVPVGGESWVIQVGSFQDKDKAYKQRDMLRKSRLSAVFIEKFDQNGSLRYRVRMGPFLSRDEARVVKNKILAKYNIKGWLMKYEK
jgi:DedD protein